MNNMHFVINSLKCKQKELEITIWAYEFVENMANQYIIDDVELLTRIGNNIAKNIKFLWEDDSINNADDIIREKAVEIWKSNIN